MPQSAHVDTTKVVFVEHVCLHHEVIPSNVFEGRQYQSLAADRKVWFRGAKVEPVRDRWIYTLAEYVAPSGPDGLLFNEWRLLHEYYVDGNGYYHRSDEAELFESKPADRHQALKPAAHRRAKMEATKAANSGATYVRLPFYVHGAKCNIVSFAMAFPLPATLLDDLLEMARDRMLPWVVYWSGNDEPAVNYLRTVEVSETHEDGGSTQTQQVDVDSVPTVDPLELSVRTNKVLQADLKKFRKIETEQTDEQRFARELHQVFNTPSVKQQVTGQLQGGSLDAIEQAFAEPEEQMRAAMALAEARATVLTRFLDSKLFDFTMRAYREDDEEEGGDSEHFVYFLYAFDAATDQLVHTRSGSEFLGRVARAEGVFSERDPVGDYIFPAKTPTTKRIKQIKTALGPVLSIYSKLLPALKLGEVAYAQQLVRQHLTAFTGYQFVALKRLPEVIPDGFFVEYHNPDEVIPGTWISRKQLREIKSLAKREAATVVGGRPIHSSIQRNASRVMYALDVINFVLTGYELEQKAANGALKFRNDVERFNAGLSLAVSTATRYVKWRYGAAAVEATVVKLSIIGFIPAMMFSMLKVGDSWESYDRGEYGRYAGQALAGWAGLVGAVLFLIPGAGWVALGVTLIAAAGGVLDRAYTRTPLQDFARFCQWGEGGNANASAQKAKFSTLPYSAWKGRFNEQRAALFRILCAFHLEPLSRPGRHGVNITLGHHLPESIIKLEWYMLVGEGQGEEHRQEMVLRGSAFHRGPSMWVWEYESFAAIVGFRVELSVTVTFDLSGNGDALIPSKGCKLLLAENGIDAGGSITSLDCKA